MTTKKGEFHKLITTQERTLQISFADRLEEQSPQQVEPPPQECLLLQVPAENKFLPVYLSRTQVDDLILTLKQARSIWFADW